MTNVRHYHRVKNSDLFEKIWYSDHYNGFSGRMNPIIHYLAFGAARGLDPSPRFSSSRYIINNPDVAKSCINPLVHYIRFGKREGRTAYPHRIALWTDLLESLNPGQMSFPRLPQAVDVIIPVFNGMVHLPALLESVFENTTTPHRFIIVDDASTDATVVPYLQAHTAGRDDCLLICNPKNLGFVATVNLAAKLCKGHFAILNTDTIVPPHWLERLMKPIFNNADIASTTPFSNAATIFSFPIADQDNPPPDRTYAEQLDRAFMQLRPGISRIHDAPTGVGFCMGINGDLWRLMGEFDHKAFGPGYGEENDYCNRAIAHGKRNILVHNLFVAHHHTGSFSQKTKRELIERNLRIIQERWPDYLHCVERHTRQDPWLHYREAAFVALCLSPEAKALVLLDHMIGGGANDYRDKVIAKAHSDGRSTILLTYNRKERWIQAKAAYRGFQTDFVLRDLEDITSLLLFGQPHTVLLNELVTWTNPQQAIKILLDAKARASFQLEVAAHDFFPLCPSYNLLNEEGRYCGVPSEMAICRACSRANPFSIDKNVVMDEWRASWRELFRSVDKTLFFSPSALKIFARAYPEVVEKGEVKPHEPLVGFPSFEYRPSLKEPLTIGVIGRIDQPKGALIVCDLARLLQERKSGWRIVVIGLLSPPCKAGNVTVLGSYQREGLPDIIRKNEIDIALFPSIWPETFSYVTQELIMLGLPIVCFDIGAQAERVRPYSKGEIATQITAESALEAMERLMERKPG
ncbi:MAG: glycosyltransferase [Syntrophobacter sp.]